MADNIKEITEQLEKGVQEIVTSEKYQDYLAFMSKFTDYSFNNTILIYIQNPGATLVAGYKSWQSKGRQVRKGEKAIKIIAPCPHKKETEVNGEKKVINWVTYRTANVFDISQTDGEEIPEYTKTLTGDVEDFNGLREKFESISPVPVSYEEIGGTANGYFNKAESRIVVKAGMSEAQTIKTLVHEIAHAMLHSDSQEDRSTKEVQAESVAYTVCSALGIDTSDYSFGYVIGWGNGKEAKELSESMETIRQTAREILSRIA